jgi:uncharacterized protein YqeY
MKASQSNLTKVKLIQENEILSEFLPATMSKDDVIIFLNAFYEQIKNQSNDGLAIKLSMAELRKMNCVFNGKDVSEIVKGIRS